jgi:hypothetical protein
VTEEVPIRAPAGSLEARVVDWKLGLSQDRVVATGTLALVGTDAERAAYASPANGKFLGKTALVAGISKTF